MNGKMTQTQPQPKPITSKTIERYRKLRKMARHSGGSQNERLNAQKKLMKMEHSYPTIGELADRVEKREEVDDTFVRPPQPPPDAGWVTRKLHKWADWAIDHLAEAQVEVLMNDAIKAPLSLMEQLEEGVELEVTDLESDDGEKYVEIITVVPLGLWGKIVSHKPFHSEFLFWLNSMVNRKD